MPNFEQMSRSCLRKFSPYVPGRPIEEIKERFHLERVIKLASNENPLGPSRKALEAIAASVWDLFRYPEGGSTRLRAALARSLGVDAGQVLAGSGSDEIIELIAKTFLERDDDIVVSEHAFIRYKMAGNLMAVRVIEVPMTGFRHDLKAMRAAITPKTKIVFLANPNNPTGTYVTRAELSAFLDGLRDDLLVVLDEAYFEYARALPDYPDSVQLLKDGRRQVVGLRTFSKAYGLAGLRTGYAVADPGVVREIDKIRPPFNVTSLAQTACEAALEDRRHVEDSVRLNRETMERLCSELRAKGIDFVPSAGNFVLIKARRGGDAAFQGLLRRGIIVRPMAEYGFPEHVRVTVGTPEETEVFLKAFVEVDLA
jgi:histidinol-phosphate aminotransferase